MLDFTKSEKQAILITVIIITAAGILQLSRSYFIKPPLYDYSKSDSIFARLSNKPTSFSETKKDSSKENNPTAISEITRNYSRKNNTTIKIENKNVLEFRSININTASCQDFERLPYIGNVIANRIINYRETNGIFTTIDDLLKVKGIGPKKMGKIKPYLSLK